VIGDFHFLRPHWLWLLLPVVLIVIANLRQQDQRGRWLRAISPALLDALLISHSGNSRGRPVIVFAVTSVLAIFALAGPSWQREASPFTEDLGALVIALKVTPSMASDDLQPSRAERAAHKIGDLLELRAGARTALVAYAGSAHLVMPLTRDAEVIISFSSELSPELMPEEGNDVASALDLARRLLQESGQPGSILLITDDLDPAEMSRLKAARDTGAAPPVVLAAVDEERSPGDADRLRDAAAALGSELEFVMPHDRDVRAVNGRLEHNLTAASDPDSAERWRDAGYLLTPLIALLSLAWFRQGWFLSWEA
jgi:Ca-activated chloride channel family protein